MLKVVENASLFLGDMQWAVGVSDAGVILASIAQAMCRQRRVPAEHRLEERVQYDEPSSDFEQSSRELPLTVSLVYDLRLPPTDAAVAQRRCMIVGECSTGVLPRRPTEHAVLLLWLSCVFEVSERHRQKPTSPDDYAHASVAKTMALRRRRLVRGRRQRPCSTALTNWRSAFCVMEVRSWSHPSRSCWLAKGHSDEELAASQQKAEEVSVPVHVDAHHGHGHSSGQRSVHPGNAATPG